MRKFLYTAGVTALCAVMLPQATQAFCTDKVPAEILPVVKKMHSEKVLRGNPDGACKLAEQPVKAEMATLLLRFNYTDEDIDDLAKMEKGSFPDLDPKQWHYKVLKAAKFEGLVKGNDKTGAVGPGNKVLAAEAFAMTFRALGIEVPAAKAGQQWYEPMMDKAKAVGMKTFAPDHQINRGDALVLISEADQKIDQLKATTGNNANNSTNNNSGGTTNQPKTSQTNGADFKKLIMEFSKMPTSEGAAIFRAMTDKQKTALRVFAPNFSLLFHNGACQSDKNLVLKTPIGDFNCTQSVQALTQMNQQYAKNQTLAQQAAQNLQREAGMLMVYHMCSNGDYTNGLTAEGCGKVITQANQILAKVANQPATQPVATNTGGQTNWTPPAQGNYSSQVANGGNSSSYDPALYKMMSDMSRSNHETTMSIINNIGGGTNCTVGEAGCVPF